MQHDWEKAPPAEWERRLREISPITDRMAHLRFRWWARHPSWKAWDEMGVQADGLWGIYQCEPRTLVTKDRLQQFDRPWWELPLAEQRGRRSAVTAYQWYMWTTHGLDVHPFWILQGPAGGTPGAYTPREQSYMEAIGEPPIPPTLALLPPCPFDERTVQQVLARDRFLAAGKDLDRLKAMDTAGALKSEDDENNKRHREDYLKWWREVMTPCSEFMKSQVFKQQMADLPPAPEGLANKLSRWREEYIETGQMVGATNATQKVQMPVLVNV